MDKSLAISRRPGHWRRLAGGLLGVCALAVPLALVGATSAAAGDTPAGFLYGTDTRQVTISGSAPYRIPVIGGYYGGYIGMTGNWAILTGCHKIVIFSATNSARANANHATYTRASAPACTASWAGPAVDPHYNGTTSEATPGGRGRRRGPWPTRRRGT